MAPSQATLTIQIPEGGAKWTEVEETGELKCGLQPSTRHSRQAGTQRWPEPAPAQIGIPDRGMWGLKRMGPRNATPDGDTSCLKVAMGTRHLKPDGFLPIRIWMWIKILTYGHVNG